jgi:hypothetical protein
MVECPFETSYGCRGGAVPALSGIVNEEME